MGQAVSCCYTASARDNDDSEYNMYCRGEQPWKEKIKTKFSTVDPKFKVVHIPGQGQLRRFPNMDLTF